MSDSDNSAEWSWLSHNWSLGWTAVHLRSPNATQSGRPVCPLTRCAAHMSSAAFACHPVLEDAAGGSALPLYGLSAASAASNQPAASDAVVRPPRDVQLATRRQSRVTVSESGHGVRVGIRCQSRDTVSESGHGVRVGTRCQSRDTASESGHGVRVESRH